jgi:signal peptidase I
MCIPSGGACDDWTSVSHPFDRTLHKGDIIIIQGVEPSVLNGNYPDSDIIVFHRPDNPSELIVHRIVKTETINGKLYFYTKGDGNSPPDTWPTIPQPYQYDPWRNNDPDVPQGAVSQDLVVGKVVMRIPWVGHIAIFMHDALGVNNGFLALPIIIILIILIIIIEFVVPLIRRKKTDSKPENPPENPL